MSLGRPPLPPAQKRTVRKEVRFSEAEYSRLCLAALKLRMDVSEFMRVMVLPELASAIDPAFSVRIENTEFRE